MRNTKGPLLDSLKQVSWALFLVYIILLGLVFLFGKQIGYEISLRVCLGVAGLVTVTFISVYLCDLLRIVIADRILTGKADITCRNMCFGEEDLVFDLVKTGFDEYILHDVTEEGAKEFLRAAREMIYDRPAGHFILVSESRGVVSGMIDVRNNSHLCLFFVAREFQRKGVGKGLLDQAIRKCVAQDPGVSEIEVHASLFAVPIYKRLGFREVKPEQIVNGIRFVRWSGRYRNDERTGKSFALDN